MNGFKEGVSDPAEFELDLQFEKFIREDELRRRIGHPKANLYIFKALTEDNKVIQKLSEVDGVHPRAGAIGLHVVQFGLLHPISRKRQTTNVSYFRGGIYEGQVREGESFAVSLGNSADAKVISGHFINALREENGDNLLEEASAQRRLDDPII